MSARIRLRYAPSPTGDPHVGNIRTAIYDWLYARHFDGEFVLRIEDTDQNRKQVGAEEIQLEALKWLGLDWDEGPDKGGPYGPYRQSERLEYYDTYASQLIDSGHAYRCYCTQERLADIRKLQIANKDNPGYDRYCRDVDNSDATNQNDSLSVVRFKMPLSGVSILHDLVRGEVKFQNHLVDDFVIVKSDGFPTYHFASVVDDHLMEISHVFRGEDWLSSAPRHLNLYDSLGWNPPEFAHLPNILAPDKSKLSKRHGATSITEYREQGYLPHSMVNFLTLLGWSLDDKSELFSQEDLVREFSIERVSRSGAVFDVTKLDWMNGHYIRDMDAGDLAREIYSYWLDHPPLLGGNSPNEEFTLNIVPLVQERLKKLVDAAPLVSFLLQDEVDLSDVNFIQKGMDAESTKVTLERIYKAINNMGSFDAANLDALLRPMAGELGLKVGQLFGLLRLVTTGLDVAPPLFETMEVMGKERTISSIETALNSF